MPIEWFARIDEQEQGPFTPQQLRALVQEGKIGPDSLVRQASMQHWAYAKHIQGLIAGAREVARTAPPSVLSGANAPAAHGKAAAAPVPEKPEQWFCKSVDDQVFGPYAMAQLKQFAKQGRITTSTLLRRGPDGQWISATSVEGLLTAQAPAMPPATPSSAPGAPPQVLQLPVTANPDTDSPQTSSNRAIVFGMGSIALGCLGFVTFWIPVIGLCIITAGLVLGIAGIRLGRKGRGGIGLSIAGTVISAVIFVPTSLFWGAALLLFSSSSSNSHNTPTPHIPQPAAIPPYAQREPESPKQEGLEIPEPLNWSWVLAAFGPDSKLSSSQKTALFEYVKGKMLEVTGTWKSDAIRGARIRPAGFSQDVNVPWAPSETDYVRRIRDGDLICAVGRLTDYPGILSSFELSNSTFQRDKSQRAFDRLPKAEQDALIRRPATIEKAESLGCRFEYENGDRDEGPASVVSMPKELDPMVLADLIVRFVDFPKLRSLNLTQTQIDDVGLQAVGQLTNLEELFFLGNTPGFTDAGLAHLTHLRKLKSVAILSMDAKVTAKGIALLGNNSHLQRLIIRRSEAKRESFEALKGLPDLSVEVYQDMTTGTAGTFGTMADHLIVKATPTEILPFLDKAGNMPFVQWPFTSWSTREFAAKHTLKEDSWGILLAFDSHPPVVLKALDEGLVVWQFDDDQDDMKTKEREEEKKRVGQLGLKRQENIYAIFDNAGHLKALVSKRFYPKGRVNVDSMILLSVRDKQIANSTIEQLGPVTEWHINKLAVDDTSAGTRMVDKYTGTGNDRNVSLSHEGFMVINGKQDETRTEKWTTDDGHWTKVITREQTPEFFEQVRETARKMNVAPGERIQRSTYSGKAELVTKNTND